MSSVHIRETRKAAPTPGEQVVIDLVGTEEREPMVIDLAGTETNEQVVIDLSGAEQGGQVVVDQTGADIRKTTAVTTAPKQTAAGGKNTFMDNLPLFAGVLLVIVAAISSTRRGKPGEKTITGGKRIESVKILGTSTAMETRVLATYNFTVYSLLIRYTDGSTEVREVQKKHLRRYMPYIEN